MKYLEETRPVGLEINMDNLSHNISEVRRYVKDDTIIMAVVKANAYGHGAVSVSKVFLENGADRLAVSILPEGIELRKAGIKAPILILNYTPPSQYDKILENNLTQNIYSYEDAILLSRKAVEQKKEGIIHIKIDTGMSRIGFLPNEESIKDIIKISQLPNIKIEGIFTHFARSDEKDKTYTKGQYDRFIWTLRQLEKNGLNIPIKHVSNSAAILDMPEYNLDMVRPGIILYGYYPSEYVNKNKITIKPAMKMKSSISNIKIVPKGTGISYNQDYTTKKESTIATLPVGYADGYSRMLTGKSQVSVMNKRVPVVGSICMDQLMIDITDIEDVKIGDEVVLFGYGNNTYPTVEEIARLLGTVSYEVICMASRRVPRVYTKNSKLSHIVDYVLD